MRGLQNEGLQEREDENGENGRNGNEAVFFALIMPQNDALVIPRECSFYIGPIAFVFSLHIKHCLLGDSFENSISHHSIDLARWGTYSKIPISNAKFFKSMGSVCWSCTHQVRLVFLMTLLFPSIRELSHGFSL